MEKVCQYLQLGTEVRFRVKGIGLGSRGFFRGPNIGRRVYEGYGQSATCSGHFAKRFKVVHEPYTTSSSGSSEKVLFQDFRALNPKPCRPRP